MEKRDKLNLSKGYALNLDQALTIWLRYSDRYSPLIIGLRIDSQRDSVLCSFTLSRACIIPTQNPGKFTLYAINSVIPCRG
ncbi:hypothetical protein C3418_12335 [Aeromonas sp. ASNIH8]|nr:hypothetical protein MC65_020430 [Aeromonas caviae]POV91559.1 hypothetical protein C3418_12335 [Aeromonas sp. ASNIH8]